MKELIAEGSDAFARLYRMELYSFTKLCDILCPEIEVDEHMSTLRSSKGPITVAYICTEAPFLF